MDTFDYKPLTKAYAEWQAAEGLITSATADAATRLCETLSIVSDARTAGESLSAIAVGSGIDRNEVNRLVNTLVSTVRWDFDPFETRTLHTLVRAFVDAQGKPRYLRTVAEAKSKKGLVAALGKTKASTKVAPTVESLLKSSTTSLTKIPDANVADPDAISELVADLTFAYRSALESIGYRFTDSAEEDDSPAEHAA